MAEVYRQKKDQFKSTSGKYLQQEILYKIAKVLDNRGCLHHGINQ